MSTSESTVEAVREGCRWIYNPPAGEDFAEWFRENVTFHEGLDPGDYVNGIALIPNKETVQRTGIDSAGNRVIVSEERLVFTPYPQVETRVRYFWDWCRENKYLGVIEPVLPKEQSKTLPFGVHSIHLPASPSTNVVFMCASYQVRVFERDVRTGGRGRLIMEPPLGSKLVPMLGTRGYDKGKPDVNAIMRAQTGAIGRGLGFAGMLIVPGTGVSSAEDMLDLASPGAIEQAAGTLPAAPVELAPLTDEANAQGPRTSAEVGSLEETVKALLAELAEYPEWFEQFQGWANERELNIETPVPASLRPLEKQLQRKLADARAQKGDAA